jgi:hypothetical protein
MDKAPDSPRRLRIAALAVAFTFTLAACGGGGGGSSTPAAPPPAPPPETLYVPANAWPAACRPMRRRSAPTSSGAARRRANCR